MAAGRGLGLAAVRRGSAGWRPVAGGLAPPPLPQIRPDLERRDGWPAGGGMGGRPGIVMVLKSSWWFIVDEKNHGFSKKVQKLQEQDILDDVVTLPPSGTSLMKLYMDCPFYGSVGDKLIALCDYVRRTKGRRSEETRESDMAPH
uniref:Uncharacterized protein n=1 Tax=Oryza rufipogon TaxID=4529 RepID=A0A0H3YIU8_ORYRU|nr:hypothetical protein [Oryza rufipogon]